MGYQVNHRGTEEQRFWRKVIIAENGCWLWTGAMSDGYGMFSLARITYGEKAPMVHAYVWAYEYCIGHIPDGLELDHLCRNRRCVNPWHMEPVTTLVNIYRGASPMVINAQKLFCIRGHPLQGENLRIDYVGGRQCRVCDRMRARRGSAKYRAKFK